MPKRAFAGALLTGGIALPGAEILEFKNSWPASCKVAGLVDGDAKPAALFHNFRRTRPESDSGGL